MGRFEERATLTSGAAEAEKKRFINLKFTPLALDGLQNEKVRESCLSDTMYESYRTSCASWNSCLKNFIQESSNRKAVWWETLHWITIPTAILYSGTKWSRTNGLKGLGLDSFCKRVDTIKEVSKAYRGVKSLSVTSMIEARKANQ